MNDQKQFNRVANISGVMLEAALDDISEFSSGDAENAAHIAIIRALWEYIPANKRPTAAAEVAEIVAASEGIRY